MTKPTSLKGEKERFRRLLLGISIAIAVGFLMLGLSFYSLLSDQVRVATQRAVVQLLEKHRESFALEIFLHKSGAYKLRVEEIVKDAAGIVQDFTICLYRPKDGEVIASTFVNCPTEVQVPGTRHLANGYAEVIFPLESGQTDDRVNINVSYRDSGNILAAVRELPWTIATALTMLVVMILAISRILDRYHQRILTKAFDMERESHTNKAIALTTKMLAHDLRKPFTMLEGMLGLLDTSKNPAQMQSIAKRHLPDVRRAMRKINTIMTDVTLMGADTPLNCKSANPETLVEASLYEVFGVFRRAEITLQYQFDHKHQLLVDGVKALRVFENILTNAVQAMRGSGHIRIATLDRKIGGRRTIEFRIANSGNSVPEVDLNHLFIPFFTKDKRGGTGLGLAICKQIVNQHGGEIRAENLTGDFGVEFVFTLPALENSQSNFSGILPSKSSDIGALNTEVDESASQLEYENKLLDTTQRLGRNLKVLIADDEAVYRSIMIEQVVSNPNLATAIEFFEADTVSDAVSLSEKVLPDIVIMDIDFGDSERDGFDAVAEMRALGLKAKICMHSNRGHHELSEACIAKGADCFLPKPMQLKPMFSLLQSLG